MRNSKSWTVQKFPRKSFSWLVNELESGEPLPTFYVQELVEEPYAEEGSQTVSSFVLCSVNCETANSWFALNSSIFQLYECAKFCVEV